jgi:ADP-heptose:LPS heptosyltransferase
MWTGSESIAGKSIFISAEQGLGDFIQFCRFIKDIHDLGAKVILEVPRPLHKLLVNLEGVTSYVMKGDPRPKVDYYCPLLSLPGALKIDLNSIPVAKNYIRFEVNPDVLSAYRNKIGSDKKIRIGLVWSGNPKHKNDQNRSIPLNKLIKFLPQQFEYVVLQKEICDDDLMLLESSPNFKSYPNDIVDFTDTAALLSCVDLVISLDTSVAHLASALGKETWLLLQSVPDWRWLLGRTDSPWYPSIKLYRQPSPGNWDSILEEMRLDLMCKFSQLAN